MIIKRFDKFNENDNSKSNDIESHIKYMIDSMSDHVDVKFVKGYVFEDGEEFIPDLKSLSDVTYTKYINQYSIEYIYVGYDIFFTLPNIAGKLDEFSDISHFFERVNDFKELIDTLKSGLTLYNNLKAKTYFFTHENGTEIQLAIVITDLNEKILIGEIENIKQIK